MSSSLTQQLVRYRTWLIAIVNAGITWIVLIIAPLGLFAVITCTALVFLGSLLTGWLSDRALLSLLQSHDRASMPPTVNAEYLHREPDQERRSTIPDPKRQNLPDR
ncbi:CRISPR-associated protein Csx18 [Pantanalinema rosaneae CENA516]|uniref:CRISPR-associated protein Csx18 n=1 Tax=Pantanalinema rosaneae TaxID=1620701 RepID=UPI003D6FE342